jgi:hypothetical protein
LHSLWVGGALLILLAVYSNAAIGAHVNYADSDDLILAAAFGGLAHPPGYPLVIGLYHGLMSLLPMVPPLLVATTTTYLLQVVAAGFLMATLLTWKLPGILVAGLGLFWGLRYAPFLHATVPEIFAFNNVLLAGWIWLITRLGARSHYRLRDYALILGLAGVMVFQHVLLGIAVIGGAIFLVRSWPFKTKVVTLIGGGLATLLLLGMWLSSYSFFPEKPEYGWPKPHTLSERWQFYWRTVYDPGGSHIEMYVDDYSLIRLISSVRVATEHWIYDLTIIGVALFAFSGYLIWREPKRSWRWLLMVWLMSGPLLVLYMRFPFMDEAGYYVGAALRFRMFYIAEMVEILMIGFGLRWLYRVRPKPVRVGMISFCVFLLVSRYPLFDASLDNFTSLWHQDILTSLPVEAVLVVDSDEIFGLYYQQLLEQVRPDIAVVPARIPDLDGSLTRLSPAWLVVPPDPEIMISMLISHWLHQEKRVFLLSPGTDLLTFLGLEANPFYAKPHGYVIEVSKTPPDYGEAYDYGLSIGLAEAPRHGFSWWLKGLTHMVAKIHVTHLHFFAMNGFETQALAHRQLAQTLMPEATLDIAQAYDVARDRFGTTGAFIGWEIPNEAEYIAWGKEALNQQQTESAYYFYTRALLTNPSSPQVHRELLEWHQVYGSQEWVFYHQAQLGSLLFSTDGVGGE